MNIEERKQKAKTSIVRAIFPGSTNHYDTLFGGNALKWMDEVAFITATRFGRKKFVTVSSDRIDFNTSMPAGNFVELIGEVKSLGKTSLVVEVTMLLESMYTDEVRQAVKGNFTLVAINDNKQAVKVL